MRRMNIRLKGNGFTQDVAMEVVPRVGEEIEVGDNRYTVEKVSYKIEINESNIGMANISHTGITIYLTS